MSPRCATATRAEGMVAALAAGPEPEWHEVMPMAAHAATVKRRIRLRMSNLLLIPDTVYRCGVWKQLGTGPSQGG
jgi:hypothetical protein